MIWIRILTFSQISRLRKCTLFQSGFKTRDRINRKVRTKGIFEACNNHSPCRNDRNGEKMVIWTIRIEANIVPIRWGWRRVISFAWKHVHGHHIDICIWVISCIPDYSLSYACVSRHEWLQLFACSVRNCVSQFLLY